MRAAVVRAFGPPEPLVIEDMPPPTPGPGEIVARVDAAGVNFADLLMIAGRYPVRPALPFVPGLEFCGHVTAVGPGVTQWRPGDRVMGAPLHGGCFADAVAVSAQAAFRAPPQLPDELAAQFIIAYGTAAYALTRAAVRPGDTVLVSGAGGGVGVAAVDIAVRMGAHVLAAASSPEKLDTARRHGAQVLIDYRREDLRARVREVTDSRGTDVVLDTVGGAVFDAALHAMAREGRLLVVGFASGSLPRIPAEYVLLKNLSVLGIGFGGVLQENPQRVADVLRTLLALHAQRPFDAEVAERFELEQTSVALGRLASRSVIGKLLIVPARTPRPSTASRSSP